MKKVSVRIDALLLVGGFSGCEYLFKRVEVRYISSLRAGNLMKITSPYWHLMIAIFFYFLLTSSRHNSAKEYMLLGGHLMLTQRLHEALRSMGLHAGLWFPL